MGLSNVENSPKNSSQQNLVEGVFVWAYLEVVKKEQTGILVELYVS